MANLRDNITLTSNNNPSELIRNPTSSGGSIAGVVGFRPQTDNERRMVDMANAATRVDLEESPVTMGSEADITNNVQIEADGVTSTWTDNDIWKIKATFNNLSGKEYVVSGNNLIELAINHSITNQEYLKGYILLNSNIMGESLFDRLNNDFIFRCDGRDELKLEVNPIYESLPDVWFTDLEFIVYDIEDIPTEVGHFRKIHFWHKPFHIMRSKEIKFSTANYISSDKDVYLLNDDDRKILSGDAVKYIFELLGLEDYIDEDNWDRGSNKLFYTTNVGDVPLDIIFSIVNSMTSADGDHPCTLYYNRIINKFQIIPLPKFFELAGKDTPGEYQLEHFWIDVPGAGLGDLQVFPRMAPLDENPSNLERDIKIQYMSRIAADAYTLTEMSGYDSSNELIPRVIHSYDFASKKFKMFVEPGDISTAKEYFEENYTDHLYPVGNSSLFILNKDKTEKKMIKNLYYNASVGDSKGIITTSRNYFARAAIFLNLGITFNVPGSTHRHPGRFIAIEKNSATDNKYDYRLLGQWFVTDVIFSWHRNVLKNYITGVKTHAYGDLKIREDV